MARFRMATAELQLARVSLYNLCSSSRASVSSACALAFSCKLFSLSAIILMRPVSGWLMALSKVEMSPSKVSICFVLDARLSSLDFVSSSHHVFCSRSWAASFDRRSFILSISSRTMLKGLPKAKRPAILAMRASLAADAASRRTRCAATRWLKSAPRTRRLTERNCTKPVAPVVVAVTLLKVSNASSLFSTAMASLMAASSICRSSTRLSYSFDFSPHISSSLARNSWSASSCVLAVSREDFFVPRSPSLPPKVSCFVW
mmetsp:Transcript_104333/g.292320  ORF Transcript_104333/g.292320 Transcript_104333/m.292320 type:complete len:260 (-) Transcript_104333:1350-2129(-)